MRILHIVAGLPPGGGIAESVPMLCRHLRGLGHEVMLATLDGPMSEAALQAEKEGVRLVRFVPSWPRALYFSWAMTHGLAALATQADVVHVHSNWTFPVWWGCRCALRAGQPLVMSPRGCLDPVRLLHSAWKKQLVGWLDRYFLKRATVIHATAECERGWIEKYLGGNRQSAIGKEDVSRKGAKAQSSSVSPHFSFLRPRIVVIPNGVEVREVRKFESSEVLKCESWRHEVRGQRSEAGERSSKVRECESSKVGGSGTVGNRQSAIGNGENARKDAKTPSELEPAPLGAMEPLNLETSAQRDGTLEPLRLRTVLYLGRLHPLKGLDLLISAWAEIKGSIAPMALGQR